MDISTRHFRCFLMVANDAMKQAQWRGFLRKSKLDVAPPELGDAIDEISRFLMPLNTALFTGQPFVGTWPPRGPWQVD